MTKTEKIVVKIGSSLLIGEDGTPRTKWLETLVSDIAGLHQDGNAIIIVSSGSIALGARKLGLEKGGRASLADAQAAASVGQIALSSLWSELLAAQNITAAQMLLTLDDMEDRKRYLNATATLEKLLENRAIPVINENDSVATDEIRFGDNDRLAARVAQAASADRVLLLSDVDGLYDRKPGSETEGQFIGLVETVDDRVMAMAQTESSSGLGSGGMVSKLEAARIANLAGIELSIISGQEDHPLQRYELTNVGTLFKANRSENARKSWLGGRLTSAGRITVDEGAATALKDGNSLLAKGIITLDGQFARSDVVDIIGPDETVIAKGLVEYDAMDCAKIIGRHSSELEALLGYSPRSAVVHRNQMVLL
ncbi:glutamate 5-kinase [Parasphingorhabdus halotolerans]|uniref:Glutamate 5-kinase n=1 Tax=Parasphingorhabdus halotolerans TaxID=2725558 RepID=A0A6H2DLR7_9SPHN|nr:glutamate 5-kinase [Parasphingorhabdus halotolerans]QJB69294.1 glutamate 5-kinase [Parasphingorhabdus halotolerans]